MRVSPDVNALAAELARLQRSGRLPAETARAFEEALKGAAAPAPARDTARAAFFAPTSTVAAATPMTTPSVAAAPAERLPPRPGSLLDIKV
jgi:hypothetical protein